MRIALTLLLVLSACDDSPEATGQSQSTPAYSVHEWGFLAHHFADGASNTRFVGATPGRFHRMHSGEGIGIGSLGARGGKPILYVHLPEGVESLDLAATLTLGNEGSFTEHLPPGELNGTTLTWNVTARRGSCSARERYPSASDPRCREPSDGYCEAAELYAYETNDAACLRVGEADWNHLFYRAQAPGTMPIRIESTHAGQLVHNDASAPIPSKLIRIRRHASIGDTRVHVFDAPAPGQSIPMPDATESAASDASGALRSALESLGMTGAETNAFMIAWEAELLGEAPDASERPAIQVGVPPRELRSKADALVYFMPRESVDSLIGLELDPPPTDVRRAMLVRVDLNAHPESTIGLGNLGTIGHGDSYGVSHARRAQVVQIRSGDLEVTGPLPREVVRRFIRRYISHIRRCYEEAGNVGEGALTFQLQIDAQGSVTTATLANNALSDAIGACVTRVARAWRFPDSEGDVRVEQTLVFIAPPASSDSDEGPARQ